MSKESRLIITNGMAGVFLHRDEVGEDIIPVAVLNPQERRKLISYMKKICLQTENITEYELRSRERIMKLFIPTVEEGRISDDPKVSSEMIRLNCFDLQIAEGILDIYQKMRSEQKVKEG